MEVFIFKGIRKIFYLISDSLDLFFTTIILRGNGVQYGKKIISNGIPIIDVWKKGIFIIGDSFQMNNGGRFNMIGRQQKCYFIVRSNAILTIGNNVGMSSTAIVCACNITIGDNVKIGGNCVIYDTDFHSLDSSMRKSAKSDFENTKQSSVIIENDVFIGAHSTILKGVIVGNNSIVGACSVVSKSIPSNELWAGNPAKFIRKC